jgi:DNA topoisomerase-1
VLAAKALQEMGPADSEADARRNVVAAIDQVAERLANTRDVCRKCHVDPAIVDSYLDGTLLGEEARERSATEVGRRLRQLSRHEAAVLALLKSQRDTLT